MDAPRLKFLGTGNAFSDGGRANQTLLLSGEGARWLVDCGPTAALQMRRFGESFRDLDGICLTHLHADHALGVPMVFLTLNFLELPTKPLQIVGPPGTESYVEKVWDLAYPDVAGLGRRFEVEFTELDGEARDEATFGPLHIASFPMRHSVPVNGYRFGLGNRRLAVSGDTSIAGPLADLARDADLLVVECNSLAPIPGVTHTSVAEHREGLPYGARRVALVHCGAGVLEQAERLAGELDAVFPADGDTLPI